MRIPSRASSFLPSSSPSCSSGEISRLWVPSHRIFPSRNLSSKIEQSAKKLKLGQLSTAPMMNHTDRHWRYFFRLLTKHTTLYTEMITAPALVAIRNDREKLFRHLAFNPVEEPVVVQLGGADPHQLAEATRICVDWGYKEINLNCGCPSPKVAGKGMFGASLMMNPSLVAQIVHAMEKAAGDVPITVKCRIGVDSFDSYENLLNFVQTIQRGTKIEHFIVHARKALLKLSPESNRRIPPLNYDYVYKLAKDINGPSQIDNESMLVQQLKYDLEKNGERGRNLRFTINGGIKTLKEIESFQEKGIWGMMIGREALHNPLLFMEADQLFEAYSPNVNSTSTTTLPENHTTTSSSPLSTEYFLLEKKRTEKERNQRLGLIEKYFDYISDQQAKYGINSTILLAPLSNIFHGLEGASVFKRTLDAAAKQHLKDISKAVGAVYEQFRYNMK